MAEIALGVVRRIDQSKIAVVVLLALVFGLGMSVSDRFASAANLSNVLEQAAALGFVSLGQTLVVLAGGIDLSIGALVSAIAVMIANLCQAYPDFAVAIIGLALCAGALVGVLNAAATILLRVHPLVVTIGTATLLSGLTLMVARQPSGQAPIWLEEFAFGRIGGLPYAGLAMLLAYGVVGLGLLRHSSGRRVYAVGGNSEAARLTGLPVRLTTMSVYAASGIFSAIAAVYYVARTGTGDPLVGEPLTLASITPVVVGGTLLGGGRGGAVGTLLGVFLISLLNNLLNYMNVSTFLQWVVQGLIIITAVSFQIGDRRRS